MDIRLSVGAPVGGGLWGVMDALGSRWDSFVGLRWKGNEAGFDWCCRRVFAAAEGWEGRVSRLGKRGGDAEGEERAPLWYGLCTL
jgi:hypothetical protein